MWLDNINSKIDLFLPSDFIPCFTISIQIKLQCRDIWIEVLLDTRVLGCFIDKDFTASQNLTLIKKAFLAPIEVIDGRLFASKNVIEETQLLEVIL